MEEKRNFQINFKSYLFQVELLDENKVNISASNSVEGELYEIFNHKFEKIQSKCLIPALEEKQPNTLQAKLSYQNRSLVLEIIVKYDFIPEMRETIEINRKEIEGDEKINLLLKQSQKNLYDLQEKFQASKDLKRVVSQKEAQKFDKKNTLTPLLKIELTPGDYEVTFNFFVNPTVNFIDLQFYVDNKETDQIPSNGFYATKTSVYLPYTLKAVFQLKKKSTISVQTKCSQGGFQAKEMILLAERITSLTSNNN